MENKNRNEKVEHKKEAQKEVGFEFKGELQCENKLISSERAFKMLKNDMYIAGTGQAVLELSGTTIKKCITEETLYELLPGNFDIAFVILKF